jgi:repressor LexA
MPALTFWIMEDLTDLEAKVLEHLSDALRNGVCPSREELSQAVGLGGRGYHISKVLDSLEAKGYIEWVRGRSRAITLRRTADGRPFSPDTCWVPLVGRIAAGQPARVAAQPEVAYTGEAIELARSLLGGYDNVYALRVKGHSMVDALVDDGDTVILAGNAEVRNGDMVAASVRGEDGQVRKTLKYYFRENGHVRLQPANPQMGPLYYHPSQVKVEGKVVLVIRKIGR